MSSTTTSETTKLHKELETEKANEELESIMVVYNGKQHTVKFPINANAKVISQSIKKVTGVKGSFYVHFGEKTNNYLHSSSVTSGNLAKLAGQPLELRGGNAFNKGGDSIWYYNSQALKPEVTKKCREMEIVPFDNPP
ncbi:hypothetical protein pdam_00015923 [Pocillopora damicornis]|uniref:Uncharacterized protein n=1 Tax=Pocillopora damicornis TaxID=46731 RepID=A0A3M6UWK0_POCDA|nr:uncharacterized protein LOC113683759 [Pocillopora damicornis]RMX57990.1 hypothetical protein pdam_00015923 [Pocillopora damicornis]